MKKRKELPSRFVFAVIVVLLVAAGLFSFRYFKSPTLTSSNLTANKLKTFKSSSVMDFTIQVPEEFEVEERFGSVTIKTEKGEMYINRNGTQHGDLSSYISKFDQKTDLEIKADEELVINNLQARARIFKNTDVSEEEKIYFIYASNAVYFLSTKETALYPTLDQIAHSFRYTPN